MKPVFDILKLSFVVICFTDTGYCNFLGGTISWMQDISTNCIRFTYRLTWMKGTGPCGPACSPAQMGTDVTGSVNTSLLSSLQWRYISGSKISNLSDVNYYVTSVSNVSTLGWEQGENWFTDNGNFDLNKPYKVYLNGVPWIRSVSDSMSLMGYMETRLDLRTRNDTGMSNNSPYVSLQPYLGVAFGSSTRVRLSAVDQDGDIVRCRWAKPDECKAACTNIPLKAVKLNKIQCTLTVHAYRETGMAPKAVYRLAIVIEDFPYGLIQVGKDNFTRQRALSTIPLQFVLKTSSANGPYTDQDFFVNPYLREYDSASWKPGSTQGIGFGLSLHADDISSTEFMASLPRYMTYTTTPDFLNKTNFQQNVGLRLPQISQSGYLQVCFWALRSDGVTRDSGCREVTINDINHCQNQSCNNNGSCVNLYNVTQSVCSCPLGYKPPECSEETACPDDPCENNASCSQNKSAYTCVCRHGFRGKYCELEEDKCLSSPCQYNGTCLDSQDQYVCLCQMNYTGNSCEILITDETEHSKSNQDKEIAVWIPVTASVGGLAALVGASICIYKFKPSDTDRTRFKSKRIKPIKSSATELKPVNIHDAEPKNLNF